MTKVSHLRHITMSLSILLAMLVLAACGSSARNDTKKEKETPLFGIISLKKEKSLLQHLARFIQLLIMMVRTNELTGYEVEIMKEIGKRLELDIKFVGDGLRWYAHFFK